MNINKTWIIPLLLLATGCRQTETAVVPSYEVAPYRQDTVVLQNLQTRVLVYCYDSPEATAQDCAAKFEKDGFVRLENIPRLPAEYDTLKEGTYPTRRWRNGEAVSRW